MIRPLGKFAVLVVALALASCGSPTSGPPSPLDDVLLDPGVVKWGCDAQGGAPYAYLDPDDFEGYVGFEVEIMDELGKTLKVRPERTQNQWDLLIPGLLRADYDIAMNGIEITPERQAVVLFSKPYYVTSLEVTVPKGKPMYTSLASLRGKKVGTLKGSFAYRVLRDAGGIDLSGYEGQVEPYKDLAFGRIDIVVMDWPISRFWGQNPDFDTGHADYGEARYAIAVAPGPKGKRLVAAIDAAIDDLARTGKLHEILDRYGIWNEATAELLNDHGPSRAQPVMLESWERMKQSTIGTKLLRYVKMLKPLGKAALTTLELSVLGMSIAVALGLVLALMRVYGPSPIRILATIFIEGVRGTPLLIQLYIIFYGLPDLGLTLPRFPAAVFALGLNYAAYEAENYRAGITSIALGQTEAAHALGLTQVQTLRYIIVPQALRLVIPPVTNDFIALLKDSSIVSMIAMVELTFKNSELASATNDRIGVGLLAGGLYFLLGWPFAKLAAYLETRARRGRR